ncbi:chemotaxis protein CheW [Rossellomorea sp. FS2]|uniref:chemotaxis protein CheW n=1 Tax=Rossellomorea TaxID=2837508 RepID=UPI003A4E0DF0
MIKVIVFHAGKEEYALPVDTIVSIEKSEGINPIPHLPSFVLGVTKVRGELIPVFDLAEILYSSSLDRTNAFLIVVKSEIMPFGLLVKEAKEIMEYSDEALTQVGLLAYGKADYFSGIINLEDRMLTQIDPDRLVAGLKGVPEIQAYVTEQEVQSN